MSKLFIRLNNFLTSLRNPRVKPEELLLLVPHCLQLQSCERNVRGDLINCARCGKCPMNGILALKDRYGIHVELVSGGRKAVAAARSKSIKAIVAVACGKELRAGLRAVFPKATVAIPNEQTEGPCVNTKVDIDAVEAAVRRLLGLD